MLYYDDANICGFVVGAEGGCAAGFAENRYETLMTRDGCRIRSVGFGER